MAVTCMRAVRTTRSMCAPVATVIGFSFLLTWIFVLYQPSVGPGPIQKLGWQSWEPVVMSDQNPIPAPLNQSTTSQPANTTVEIPEPVDWWNVTEPDVKIDASSFPLDVWAPLLPHTTGRASNLDLRLACRLIDSTQYLRSPLLVASLILILKKNFARRILQLKRMQPRENGCE